MIAGGVCPSRYLSDKEKGATRIRFPAICGYSGQAGLDGDSEVDVNNESVSVLIAEAIKSADCDALVNLLKESPEQVSAHTPFAGQTWLGYAAQLGDLNVVKVLLEAGADVNAGDRRHGSPPICSAAHNGHFEVVAYLLNAGARFDLSESVRNPLFAAIVGRSPRIASLLLEAGIDGSVRYNSKTMKNMDGVAFALMRGERECAEIIALWNASGDEDLAKQALDTADGIATLNAYS